MIFKNLRNPVISGVIWLLYTILSATSVAAQPSIDKLNQLLKDDFFQRATIGINVYDLTDQKTLYVHNAKRLCRPASNMKLLTSATALTVLTADYVFETGLYHTGTLDATGRLTGDIWLVGGFDPELKSSDLDALLLTMQQSGIKTVEGNLFLDVSMGDSLFWGKAWSWDDDMEEYQPYLSPIPLNKGVAKLKVIPATPSRPPIIKTEPETSFIQIVNRATTVLKNADPPAKSLRFNRETVGDRNRIVVSGVIQASEKPYETKISLKNPTGYVMTLFFEKMSVQFPGSNIRVAGIRPVPENAQKLGIVAHTLAEVIRQVNKESDNLNAEMLLYALGNWKGARPSSTEEGISVIQQFITQTGLDPKTYKIVDGSGLSVQNYLTPELLVEALKYMYQSQNLELFRNSLPIAGEDGTLANRMKNTSAHRNVTAKTGSLTGVSTLSGYATARNGHLLAFSIMVQNFVERSSFVVTNYIDKICEALTD